MEESVKEILIFLVGLLVICIIGIILHIKVKRLNKNDDFID